MPKQQTGQYQQLSSFPWLFLTCLTGPTRNIVLQRFRQHQHQGIVLQQWVHRPLGHNRACACVLLTNPCTFCLRYSGLFRSHRQHAALQLLQSWLNTNSTPRCLAFMPLIGPKCSLIQSTCTCIASAAETHSMQAAPRAPDSPAKRQHTTNGVQHCKLGDLKRP